MADSPKPALQQTSFRIFAASLDSGIREALRVTMKLAHHELDVVQPQARFEDALKALGI